MLIRTKHGVDWSAWGWQWDFNVMFAKTSILFKCRKKHSSASVSWLDARNAYFTQSALHSICTTAVLNIMIKSVPKSLFLFSISFCVQYEEKMIVTYCISSISSDSLEHRWIFRYTILLALLQISFLVDWRQHIDLWVHLYLCSIG